MSQSDPNFTPEVCSGVETTDGELVARVLGGEAEAYGPLVARYRARYSRFALHMLGNREDAEEALQDAFVRAYRALPRCEDRDRFGAWLFTILINRCRTAGARRGRYERVVVTGEHPAIEGASGPQGDQWEWREEIARALGSLPEDQREAFLLKHVEDRSYEEMADLTGIGVSALKMRVKRACDRLRTQLEEVYVG